MTTILSGENALEEVKAIIINESGTAAEVGTSGQLSVTQFLADGTEGFIQGIKTSANNSTTDNLNAGATYTGTSEETFGINGIQVYHYADQNCSIYVDQSLDNTNWDITDEFECLANNACTRTFISVAPYFRIRITNDGAVATTTLRAAAGMTPIINPLPRSLTEDGRLKTETTIAGRENTERHAWVNPTNEMAVSTVPRLIGTAFVGNTKDPNFWDDTETNNGTVVQASGVVTLATSATSEGAAKYTTVRNARFVAGSAMIMAGGVNWVTAGTTDNVRRVGAYNTTDGYFFQLNGETFSVGTRIGSSDTLVNSGSFNGNYGVSWTPTANTYYKITIEFTPLGALYYINGKLLHKTNGAGLSATQTLPITIENTNGTITTDVTFKTVGLYVSRQGELQTNSTYYHLSGNAATHILKYGAGVLHKIMFNNTSGTSLTIYDNTSAAAPVIGIITTASGAIGEWSYDVPFSNGLTLVTVGNSLDATIVYE